MDTGPLLQTGAGRERHRRGAVPRDVTEIHPGGEITDGHRQDGIIVYADLVG
ncbi:hypothetical protein GTW69_27875 [Streptomyces sp. SID7760]|nr:hypothetical protein [Streptomyces sp. SID7760]